MKRSLYFITILLLLLFVKRTASAQDSHFSQFYELAIINNPALTGIFTNDYKVGVLYRSQWGSIATPYKTEVFDGEAKVRLNNVNDFISFGLMAYSDKAGAITMQTTAVYPAVNYNKSLEDKYGSYISVGFMGGYLQRSIDISKMTFDNQYQNGYSASNGTGESQMPNPKIPNWDLGAGVSFSSSLDAENKINYFAGAALYHVTGLKTSFYNYDKSLTLADKWVFNFGVNYLIDETYSVKGYVNITEQNPYQEIVTGLMGRWSKVNQFNQQPFALSAGVFYRYQDAIIPTVKVEFKNNSLAVSYDVNTSSLKAQTAMRGGFEITLFNSGMLSKGYDDKHLCPRF